MAVALLRACSKDLYVASLQWRHPAGLFSPDLSATLTHVASLLPCLLSVSTSIANRSHALRVHADVCVRDTLLTFLCEKGKDRGTILTFNRLTTGFRMVQRRALNGTGTSHSTARTPHTSENINCIPWNVKTCFLLRIDPCQVSSALNDPNMNSLRKTATARL